MNIQYYAICLLLVSWICVTAPGAESIAGISPINKISHGPENNHQWRYTVDGWKQFQVQHGQIVSSEPTQVQIHPLVWTGLSILLVLGVIGWASSEWEWSQLMQSLKRLCRLPVQETDDITG